MATLAYNKKATFDYEIVDKYEAGIELLGLEVKSVKANRAHLEGARVLVRGGEVFLVGTTIPPYQQGNTAADYAPDRNRRLLLTKKQIIELSHIEGKKGLTIVPLSLYIKGRKIKAEIAVVRGKKKYDKRETIKKRDTERDIAREYSAR